MIVHDSTHAITNLTVINENFRLTLEYIFPIRIETYWNFEKRGKSELEFFQRDCAQFLLFFFR